MSPGLDPRSTEADGRALAVFKRFAIGFLCLQMLSGRGDPLCSFHCPRAAHAVESPTES